MVVSLWTPAVPPQYLSATHVHTLQCLKSSKAVSVCPSVLIQDVLSSKARVCVQCGVNRKCFSVLCNGLFIVEKE